VIDLLQKVADNTVGPCEINLNDIIPRFTLNSICGTKYNYYYLYYYENITTYHYNIFNHYYQYL